jgi:hypothetical protein
MGDTLGFRAFGAQIIILQTNALSVESPSSCPSCPSRRKRFPYPTGPVSTGVSPGMPHSAQEPS